jgi:SAM-dependent methyltransferase
MRGLPGTQRVDRQAAIPKKLRGDVVQTASQLQEHYEIERSLAQRLKSASRDERRVLYTELYDELFRRVPHHPQLTERASIATRRSAAQRQASFLRAIAKTPRPVYLELGPGDCLIALTMAEHALKVYAVDVSTEITREIAAPPNFSLILTDGSSVDVPPACVDVAFSNQLMEHLHPDDAETQLRNVYAALKPGGRYFIVTPSRASGPHDVSQHFEDVATGFHLREYLLDELIAECRKVGFSAFSAYVGKDGRYLKVPLWLVRATERLTAVLPKRAGKFAPLRLLLGLRLVAERPA